MGILALLACGFLVGSQGQDQRPDPRALIKKAIAAHGHAAKRLATYTKFLGKAGGAPMKGEHFSQPNGAFKTSVKATIINKEVDFLFVYNGTKGWSKIGDDQSVVNEFEPAQYQDSRHDEYRSRLTHMEDLLTGPLFILSYQGEEKLRGQAVVAVLVSHKGRRDVRLYFNKATYLMAAMRYKKTDRFSFKEVACEIVYSDYRRMGPSAGEQAHLKRAGVSLDGAGAVACLRKLIPTQAEQEALRDWTGKLGNSPFQVREEAARQLKKEGARAIPYLRAATINVELEMAQRAKACLKALQKEGLDQIAGAAVRLVVDTRPTAGAQVLLDYLPHAQDETVAAEVKAALAHLARDNGTPHPILVQALKAREDWRRETAAAVLGQDNGAYLNKPGRLIYLPNSKFSGRVAHYEDGQLADEMEVLDFRYFNRFEDALFAEPK